MSENKENAAGGASARPDPKSLSPEEKFQLITRNLQVLHHMKSL